MDPTQVDGRYQFRNWPTGQMQLDDYPTPIGPFTGPTLLLNTVSGIATDGGMLVNLKLASLTQQGGIGTAGGQQIAGNLTIATPAISGPVPIWSLPNYLLTIQNGDIAFYNYGEGTLTTPRASIEYDLSATDPFLHFLCDGDIEIIGGRGGVGNEIDIATNGGNSFLELGVAGSFLGDTASLQLQGGASLINFDQPYPPGGTALDYDGGNPGFDAYSLNQGFAVGTYGTDSIGNVFQGGLCTDVGTGGTGVTIGSPVVGGTPSELLYTDLGGNVAN